MVKKTDEKEKAAQTMRTIDFNEDLISGDLQSLTQLVNDLKELELCYRGNHRIITLYYKGHVVFNVFKYKEKNRGKGKYKITFDFGHARYTENWGEYYAKLKAIGFSHSSDMQDKKRNNIKYIINDGDDPDWAELVKTITPLIDDFFSPDKNKDFFEDKIKTSKGALLEKIRQQEIMTALKETDTGYFIYDMEFT